MIGKIKSIMDRQKSYLSSFNFLMIAYLFFEKVGFEWYYLFVVPIYLVFIWVDVKYIMPDEFNYLHRKSPVLKELLRK